MGINNENEFKKRCISYQQISEENKHLLNNIPYIDFTYICSKCKKIPKIKIIYNDDNRYIEKLLFEECGQKVKIILNDYNFGLKKLQFVLCL